MPQSEQERGGSEPGKFPLHGRSPHLHAHDGVAQPGLLMCRCTIPELNPEMDVFRIGTLLELCRDIATALAADGRKVKVCVQQAMGEGVFQVAPTPSLVKSASMSPHLMLIIG